MFASRDIGAFLTLSGLLIAGAAHAQDEEILPGSEIQSEVDQRRVKRTAAALEPMTIIDARELEVRDRADDPPALLTEDRIGSLKSLAKRLSAKRRWLNDETLNTLAMQSLWLDEIFPESPQFVMHDGNYYRIAIEQVGSLWGGFDPAIDPFVVFLSHEVYNGLGDDRALAFENGSETVIFDWDFKRIPALALTLEKLSPEETLPAEPRFQSLEEPVRLGAPRLSVKRDTTDEDYFTFYKSSCSPEIAPTSCSSGKPVCSTAGYSPYFVLKSLKIKKDHEGCCFKGNPEIELFPLRLDATSPVGGTTTPTTNLIFSGRTITDVAGRSRFLPDVNNKDVWYTVSNGLALFPTNSGNEWSGTLVEDDEDTGVLKMKTTRVNVTRLYKTLSTIVNDSRQLDFFFLLKAVQVFLDLIGLFNDGDDLFQESIGVANNLFCTNGLGQPFPKVFSLASGEWDMQGYFACVNPSCVPPPPPPPPGGGCITACP